MKTLVIGFALAVTVALILSVVVPCICPFKSPLACLVYCG